MALLHADFPSGQTGLYGTTVAYMLNGMYATTDGIAITDDPDATITGNVVVNAQDTTLRKILATPTTTLGCAQRYWRSAYTSVRYNRIFEARGVDNVAQISIVVDVNGFISAYLGPAPNNGGTTGRIDITDGPVVGANAWHQIECKVVLSNTVGSVEVRVEGVTVLDISGIDTVYHASDANAYSWAIYQENGASDTFYTKDIALWDGSGTYNNDFLGVVGVYEVVPTSDASFNWTPSTGLTGYNLIDEAPPNDETDYIYAVTPAPAASKFGLSDLPTNVTSVKGLYAVNRSRKTDSGDGQLQVGMVSGVSTVLGNDRTITTSYTYWTDVFEEDPATSAPWTRTGVNAAQLQVNRTV